MANEKSKLSRARQSRSGLSPPKKKKSWTISAGHMSASLIDKGVLKAGPAGQTGTALSNNERLAPPRFGPHPGTLNQLTVELRNEALARLFRVPRRDQSQTPGCPPSCGNLWQSDSTNRALKTASRTPRQSRCLRALSQRTGSWTAVAMSFQCCRTDGMHNMEIRPACGDMASQVRQKGLGF